MRVLAWTANILGWPLIQFCAAYAATCLPMRYFESDSWITVPRKWERNGSIYRSALHIARWKSLLPDGAPWVGGFPKGKILQRDVTYLRRFVLETRRAELAHWCMLCAAPIFFLWNPGWACGVMAGYAILANLPCIVVQRYNRFTLVRMLSRESHYECEYETA